MSGEASPGFESLREGQELTPMVHKPDAMDLFLFSAAIWLPHRIHYDESYTTQVENHPALLIHGPLQAVYLTQLIRSRLGSGTQLRRFSFRHNAPVHLGQTLICRGRVTEVRPQTGSVLVEVWTELESGDAATTGQADVVLRA